MKVNMTGQLAEVEARYVQDEPDGTKGTLSRYRFSVDGTDVIDAIVVDDPGEPLTIYVGRVGAGLMTMMITGGVAQKATHEVPSADGGPVPDGLAVHVDGMTVYSYVVPRLMGFMVHFSK